MSHSSTAVTPFGSRAVTRRIEAGSMVLCQHCQTQVKFIAKQASYQVIANVYIGGRWNRVEHFHQECYDLAEMPWGPAQEDNSPSSTRRAMASAAPSAGVSASSGAKGGS